MTPSIRTHARALLVSAAVAGITAVGIPAAWAQTPLKNAISFQVSAENSQYTKQQNIDVGDMPGHYIRIFEFRRIFPKNNALFAGVPVKEQWTRGTADNVGHDGHVVAYVIYLMENGDKIYGKYEGDSQGATGQPTGRRNVSGNTILTGGTGKFRAIRGILHTINVIEPEKLFNEVKNEGVYWMEKE